MSDRFSVLPQYLLPKKALTYFAGWVASRRWGSLTTRLIAWFVQRYQVNMAEAAAPDLASYACFSCCVLLLAWLQSTISVAGNLALTRSAQAASTLVAS